MTPRTASLAAILAAAALALSACGSGTAGGPSGPVDSMEPSTSPSADAPSASPGDDATSGSALIGRIGTADDPDAFEIALTDESGSPIESLPAGDYTLTFADRSDAHNFHLTGPGGVDISTEVVGSDETTVEITLVAGTYTVVCDPHVSSMSHEIEVTG